MVLIILCVSCSKKTDQSHAEIKDRIDNVITQWHLSAANADYEAYFGAMDSAAVFIGTDITENWTKADFEIMCKPYFDNGSVWDFEALERNIYLSASKDFAWFDESLNTWMGLCRGSGVISKVDDEWKIQHYVLSVAISNEIVRQVIELKYEIDSTVVKANNTVPKF